MWNIEPQIKKSDKNLHCLKIEIINDGKIDDLKSVMWAVFFFIETSALPERAVRKQFIRDINYNVHILK